MSDNGMFQAASQAAQYWNGKLTRSEAQKVFDEQAAAILQLTQRVIQLEAVMGFLYEKGGYGPGEAAAWLEAKIKEAQLEQAEPATPSVQ